MASKQLDLASRLDLVSLPTLVVTGDNDRIVPTEQSVRLATELTNAELAIIPSCGHLPQAECPEPTLEVIFKFLDTLSDAEVTE